ncbi:MAG: hypothetical protein J6U43_03380 [Bacteroidales bacterium]|nr:hypothetical protein [Bacteroidales bacterium]
MRKGILQILKMLLALAGGGIIGLTIALLLTGTSINVFIAKFTQVDWIETVGVGEYLMQGEVVMDIDMIDEILSNKNQS